MEYRMKKKNRRKILGIIIKRRFKKIEEILNGMEWIKYTKKMDKKQNYQLLKAQKNFKTYKDDNNIIHISLTFEYDSSES